MSGDLDEGEFEDVLDAFEGDAGAKPTLFERAFGYFHRLFNRRQRDYRATFTTPQGKRVLTDLAGYCGVMAQAPAGTTTTDLARMQFQRDVFIHISSQLNMSQDELVELARAYAKD